MVSVGIPSIWLDHTLLNGGCRWVTVAYLFLLANRFSFQEKERSADRLRKTGSEIVPQGALPGAGVAIRADKARKMPLQEKRQRHVSVIQ